MVERQELYSDGEVQCHEQAAIEHLTKREWDIVGVVILGASNREVAERLSISEATVRHHLANIYGKLGVRSRLELVLLMLKRPSN